MFTVFAPTDDAFNALPAGTLDHLMKPENKKELADILTYHVLPERVLSTDLKPFQAVTTVEGKPVHVTKFGGLVRVGTSLKSEDLKTVIKADNLACNGVAHIINGVLLPPTSLAPTPAPTPQPRQKNLIEICESNKDLSILAAALVAAGLTDTLSSQTKMFTVFAPTDEAFQALPAGTLDHLMKPENKKELADILTYHVLPEKVLSTDLQPFQALTTVEGKPLHVTKWGGLVRVGPSLKSEDLKNVTNADNTACNGVAHIIDGVLLPPRAELVTPPTPTLSSQPKQKNLVELCESNKDLSILTAALVAAGLADRLSSDSEKLTVFAPTDEAFKALPAGTFDSLMKPENKKELVDILTYHVVGKSIPSNKFRYGERITTLEGNTV